MKAITVTQDLKDFNPNLFGNYAVSSIKRMNVPNAFYRVSNGGARTDGYNTLDNSIHEADGFYDIVVPAYDEATQNLGAIFFNVDHFTFPVEPKTQQEQDDYQQTIDDADQYGLTQTKRESDGHIMVLRFFAYIHRQVGNNNLTAARAVKVSNYLLAGMTFLNYGEMELAKNSFNNIDLSSETAANQTALQVIIDKAIERVQTYLDNE